MADDAATTELVQELRARAQEIGESHDYLDVDELDDDAAFTALVELLADPARVPDEAFAALSRDGSVWVRAAVLGAIAAGRRGAPGWQERAVKRFPRTEWGERCFTLRALAHAPFPAIPLVLPLAEDDMSGTPMAEKLAEFLDARVKRGERLSVQSLKRLQASRQAVVAEILSATEPATQAALRPPFEQWQRETIDVDFFRSLGRIVDPADHPRPTVVGSRGLAVDSVVQALTAARPKSLLVVGEPGVGKTTLVVEAIRRSGSTLAFQATAADVHAGQQFIGMLEGRVLEIVSKMEGRRIVWLFPNFEDSLWAGQHMQSPRGLLDALLPSVEAGAVTIVGEIDPVAYELLLTNRPRVARLFDVVRLPPMTDEEALEVARGWCEDNGLEVGAETRAEALDLASHYLPATSAPGNLLRLLELVRDRIDGGIATEVTPEVIIATLSDATGLPLHVLDPRAPLDLADVRTFFASRVLGQAEAVDCLVERIALVKAGLTDPTRPLGVFLFVGPTGTGKTELAKAFSAFLFGSEDRLVRLDMSEYQTPESLERLLGDATTMHDAAPLIAAVRRQPFSVLLLDEFEKAHANIWDVFLQVFDDGRLTDRSGRTVDLRHCVIILTSNLGSAIRTGPGLGFGGGGEAFEPDAVLKTVERSFRPELLNRLDRVVVFRPLEREQMRGLVEKELNAVLQRRGFRMQPWAVEWDDAAIEYLLEQGFSATLGARPLKRAVEQHLLARVATAIVERKFPEGDQFLFITAKDAGLEVTFVDPDDEEPRREPAEARTSLTLAGIALDPHGSAEEAACLRSALERIGERLRAWDAVKTSALDSTREPGFWQSDERIELLSRIEYLDRLAAAGATAARLGARLGSGRGTQSRELVGLLARRLHVLDGALRGLDAGEPADATVSLRSTHPGEPAAAAFVEELASMYASWGDDRGMRVRRREADAGLVLEVSGLGAFTLLRAEAGLHVLELPIRDRSTFDRVTVRVNVAPVPDAEAPERDGADELAIVRRYRHRPSPLVRDASGARTGKIELVLGGDFDLVREALTS